MQISTLYLKNFEGFREREFSFHPEFNLLVGENGYGKTSVLDAIATAASSWFSGFPNLTSRAITDAEIRRKTIHYPGNRFTIERQLPVEITTSGEVLATHLRWTRTRVFNVTRNKTSEIYSVSKGAYASVMEGRDVTLPVIRYFGAGRLWSDPHGTRKFAGGEEKDRKPTGTISAEANDAEYFSSRLSGYRNCLDGKCDPNDLVRWMRHERLIEIDEGKPSYTLSVVQKAIESCLPECKTVRFSVKYDNIVLHKKNGEILPFVALSDGYRNTLAMVGDIAFRIAQLNPHLVKNVLKSTPGVVLIDELDLHLHPKWQRRVIEDLRRTFPKVQFFATTHSPFLIQTLRSGEELVPLDAQPVSEYGNLSIDAIAKGIMGVDKPEVSPRYAEMVDVAKNYLETLEEAQQAPSGKLADYKKKLTDAVAPYADNPAFQALLEMKRVAKLGE